MIIKIISTQSIDFENYPENNGRPYKITNTKDMPKTYIKTYLKYLKINVLNGLLKYEVLEG